MKSRRFARAAKIAVFALVSSSLSAVVVAENLPRAHATPRHNVVVVEVDDMRADELQYMTQTLALLQGTTFNKSYVSTSLCCPSRAAFLSGQYTQNNHVQNNSGYRSFDQTNTLATWLQGSGYFTSIIGKYLNGYGCATSTPPGWDHWQALCSNIYSMYSYSLKDGANVVRYGTGAANYQTDVVANRAVATITEANASGKPFFLWLTPIAPHQGPGNRVAPRHLSAFSTYQLPSAPNRHETDVTDKPAWVQAKKLISAAGLRAIGKNQIGRLRMLAGADDLVARVVNQLSAVGQLANTDVIFTSDNGYMRGEHRLSSGKEVEFEESLAVPLIASGPDFPVAVNSDLVTNTDLAPTVAAIAGVTPGRIIDGTSLLPLTLGSSWPQRVARHFITGDSSGDGGSSNHPSGDGVRTARFSYFNLATGEKELYDHLVDPYELTNMAGAASYRSAQARLASVLTTLKTCAGSTCQVNLGNLAPTAADTAQCPNLVCTFDASLSGDLDGSIASYNWDFGDGTSGTSTTPTIVHSYSATGLYQVVLTVTDDLGATATDTLTVTGTLTNLPPVAAMTKSCTDLSCSFDGSTSNDPDGTIVAYKWTFGDGALSTSTAVMPSHSYGLPGTYTVTLTVTDDRGAKNTATTTVTVTNPNVPPTATFTKVCVALSCDFDATTSADSDGSIVDYAWDFGDGLTGSGVTITHAFAFAGVYSVTLIVTDDKGATGTAVLPVTVQ